MPPRLVGGTPSVGHDTEKGTPRRAANGIRNKEPSPEQEAQYQVSTNTNHACPAGRAKRWLGRQYKTPRVQDWTKPSVKGAYVPRSLLMLGRFVLCKPSDTAPTTVFPTRLCVSTSWGLCRAFSNTNSVIPHSAGTALLTGISHPEKAGAGIIQARC